jgi:rare lipoprotein A
MRVRRCSRALALLLASAFAAGASGLGHAAPSAGSAEPAAREAGAGPTARPALDRSGRKRVGTASVYARKFHGRRMADGTRMDARDDNAASKTLPLGTQARVTNLDTGKSATVTIQDRGPYVKGRIVDLSPATAEKIGITPKEGIAPVEVRPIALPPPAERGAKD